MTNGADRDRLAEIVAALEKPMKPDTATGQVRQAVGAWSREAELAQFKRG